MAIQRFGVLELDVPPEWTDHSVLTLVRKDTERASSTLGRNFVLTRAPFDGTFTIEELAAAHLAALRGSLPKIDVIREELIQIGDEPALARDVRFATPQHGLAQQIHVFFIHGDTAYTMVGIGPAGLAFEAIRAEVLGIVKSLRVRG